MTVGEFCNREVVIATPEETVIDIARLMRKHHVGDVVIVDRGTTGLPVPLGIVTDRDLVVELMAADVPLDTVTAGDIMSRDLVTAREEEGVWECLQRMRARGVRRVPVVNEKGGLEGILTVDDLLELFSEELLALAKVPGREAVREKRLRE